jgi:hypothetical protein
MKKILPLLLLAILLVSALAVPVAAADDNPFSRVSKLMRDMGGALYDTTLGPVLDARGEDRAEMLDLIFRIILGVLLGFVTYYLLAERIDQKIAGLAGLFVAVISIIAIQPMFFASISGLYGGILMSIITMIPTILFFILGIKVEEHMDENDWGAFSSMMWRFMCSFCWFIIFIATSLTTVGGVIVGNAGIIYAVFQLVMFVPLLFSIWYFCKAFIYLFFVDSGSKDWEEPKNIGWLAKRERTKHFKRIKSQSEHLSAANNELFTKVRDAHAAGVRVPRNDIVGWESFRKKSCLEQIKDMTSAIAHNLKIVRRHLKPADPEFDKVNECIKILNGNFGAPYNRPLKTWALTLFSAWDSATPGPKSTVLLNTPAGQNQEITMLNGFHQCIDQFVDKLEKEVVTPLAAK